MEPKLHFGKELSAMDLNNIKLDAKHTVLTPEYLENLINEKSQNNSPAMSQNEDTVNG